MATQPALGITKPDADCKGAEKVAPMFKQNPKDLLLVLKNTQVRKEMNYTCFEAELGKYRLS